MLEKLELITRTYSCRIDDVLKSLDAKDQEILIKALKNPEWTANALSVSLRKLGITISQNSIRRHRVGECSCLKN